MLSVVGILVAISFLLAATKLYPGGFDWERHYISTLLRGPAGPARNMAIAGLLIFCVSLAPVFVRLARAEEFSKDAQFIRIGGIGAMVYSALTFTPMHDLMVAISLVFLLAAMVPLARRLYVNREVRFFAAGCVCLAVLISSATIYYTGILVFLLPWAQRLSFSLCALWLVLLDNRFPREAKRRQESLT